MADEEFNDFKETEDPSKSESPITVTFRQWAMSIK